MTMKVGELIFVYGTLRPGHGANNYLKDRAVHLGQRRISAKMYDMGWFPGIKVVDPIFTSEGPTVTGDLYEITDPEVPRDLDRYEGYPDLYGRKVVQTDHEEECWVYEINNQPSETRLISMGVWE